MEVRTWPVLTERRIIVEKISLFMLCSSDKIILLNITFMEKGRKHHKNSWNKIVHVGEEEEHVLVLMLLLAIVKVLLVF